jgi:PRC-barrel domain
MVWQKNAGLPISTGCTICVVIFGSASIRDAAADDARVVLVQHGLQVEYVNNLPETFPQNESLEAKMARRFPQKVKVGDLLGLPVLDDDNSTLGHVQQVVRSPEGKIKLIVTYGRWFGWFGRPVAVPVEAVAILGKEIASLEMPPAEYEQTPTWMAGTDGPLRESDIIRIALTRR